jgi:uncharacterized damage-inducible protein DinB
MSTDPTLDRLLRHMAWANAGLIDRLKTLPDGALALAAPGNEWTVAMILDHLVGAAGGYAERLGAGPLPPDTHPPTTVGELDAIAAACATYDARLREAAGATEGMAEYVREGEVRRRARSTILAQAIHHATEHRAQIAEALATNGVRAVDLDELDLWAYGEAEGLGA